MNPQDVVDIGREAVWIGILVASPILVAGMLVGLGIGLLQALTQVQEQTVAFVPKLVIMLGTLVFTLPWVLNLLVEYSIGVISDIPSLL